MLLSRLASLLPHRHPLQVRSVACGVIAVAVLGAAIQAWITRQHTLAEGRDLMAASARSISYQTGQVMAGLEAVLGDAVTNIDPARWPDPAVLSWLRGRLAAMPGEITLLVAAPDGHTIGGVILPSGEMSGPLDVSERAFFRYHRQHPRDAAIHIGDPAISRLDGRMVVPVSRAILDADGNLAAVVRLGLHVSGLVELLSSHLVGTNGFNLLARQDGLVLAGVPGGEAWAGRQLSDTSAFSAGLPGAAEVRIGPFGLDGAPVEAVLGIRPLSRHGLIAVAGQPAADVLSNWRDKQTINTIVLPLLLAALYLVAWWSDHQQRRYNQALIEQQRQLEGRVTQRTAELRREIETRMAAETELIASRERLRRISDNLFHGLLVVDGGGIVVFANPSARRLLCGGDGETEIEGRPLDSLFRLRGNGVETGFEGSPWQRVLTEGISWSGGNDTALITPDGRTIEVAYACSPMPEKDGQSAVISFRDIGASRAAQREAVHASRLASVGQLAAGIAHEINTPIQYVGDNLRFIGDCVRNLAGIIKASRLLTEQAAPHPDLASASARLEELLAEADSLALADELEPAVDESLTGIQQVARIVASMREFSHPGGQERAPADLNSALESTLVVSRNTWRQVATVEKHLDPALPPVLCHAGAINQVFLNLIVNAAQAIESSGKERPGRIVVSTAQVDGMAEVRIADSGSGVPDQLRDKIFEPFFTTKQVGKGTGQGLAICRDVIVTKHGGAIRVEDGEQGGAVFVIRLPFDLPPVPE